jgi:hypothetical protein
MTAKLLKPTIIRVPLMITMTMILLHSPQGETGKQGPVGVTGDTGMQGDKGDKGDTGEKGLKGHTGYKGDQVSPDV